MILFDPDEAEAAQGFPRLAPRLVPRRQLRPAGAGHSTALRRSALPARVTLARYLREAQAAVALRGEVTVLLTTDEGIRGLNRRFRKKNKATDVLSFPVEGFHGGVAGDLAISVETAARQAEEQGHRLSVELRVLMLHGLLHLAGFDHETDTGEMARKERRLRAKLGLPLGLIERAGEKFTSGAKAPRSSARFSAGVKTPAYLSPPPSGKMSDIRAKARTLQAKTGTVPAGVPALRRVSKVAR